MAHHRLVTLVPAPPNSGSIWYALLIQYTRWKQARQPRSSPCRNQLHIIYSYSRGYTVVGYSFIRLRMHRESQRTGIPVVHRLRVLCFSACSTIFLSTNMPFLSRTESMYPFAMFDRSAFSPKSSSSSSVVGTQKGSRSSISYLTATWVSSSKRQRDCQAYPLKISCGLAAPEVRLRMSVAGTCWNVYRFVTAKEPTVCKPKALYDW